MFRFLSLFCHLFEGIESAMYGIVYIGILFVICCDKLAINIKSLQVQSWARKVTLYGFHLVPLPTFQLDEPARCDPFSNTHFIPLDVTWLREHVSFKGEH